MNSEHRTFFIPGLILTLAALAAMAAGIYFVLNVEHEPVGIQQPIPISHRIHAGKKDVSCFVCHTEASFTPVAGIPPVSRCLFCHQKIITTFTPILDLRRHYQENTPIEWKKVTSLPDYVKFNHSVHINRSIDCGHCHGDVQRMDRIVQVQKFEMGFCISCHRSHNATHDCFSCHH